MAFDHWWIGFFLSASECDRFTPHFDAAAAKAVLSEKSQEAIAAWRCRPADFEQQANSNDTVEMADAFIWAFNLPGFDMLAKQIITEDRFAEFATEANLFRMAVAARHTPVGILWHALGFDRAIKLPGDMGNMLIHPRDIAEAEEQTQQAYAGTLPSNLLAAARRYCSWSVRDDALGEIISFLPDGFARARQRRSGFLALARPQI